MKRIVIEVDSGRIDGVYFEGDEPVEAVIVDRDVEGVEVNEINKVAGDEARVGFEAGIRRDDLVAKAFELVEPFELVKPLDCEAVIRDPWADIDTLRLAVRVFVTESGEYLKQSAFAITPESLTMQALLRHPHANNPAIRALVKPVLEELAACCTTRDNRSPDGLSGMARTYLEQ